MAMIQLQKGGKKIYEIIYFILYIYVTNSSPPFRYETYTAQFYVLLFHRKLLFCWHSEQQTPSISEQKTSWQNDKWHLPIHTHKCPYCARIFWLLHLNIHTHAISHTHANTCILKTSPLASPSKFCLAKCRHWPWKTTASNRTAPPNSPSCPSQEPKWRP